MAENKEACWYVVHTYSGYENKVKANLEKIVENRGLQELITEVRIPMESVTEGEGEEAKTSEAKLLPSYVLIRMIMCDESWHVVRNIRGVTGFVGPGSKPVPLTEEEVEFLLGDAPASAEDAFAIGDMVTIAEGIFAGYSGHGAAGKVGLHRKICRSCADPYRKGRPVYCTGAVSRSYLCL